MKADAADLDETSASVEEGESQQAETKEKALVRTAAVEVRAVERILDSAGAPDSGDSEDH